MTTLKTDYIPTAQEALVDPVLLSNVNDFYAGKSVPSIVTILDLFSLAEALVLFDRLIAPIEWRVSEGFEEIDLSYLGNLSNKIAFNDDLNWFSVDYGIPNDEALDYAMNFCFGIDKRFSSQ